MALVRIERPNEIPYELAPHDGLLVFPLSESMEFSHEYAAVGTDPHERKRKCTVMGMAPKKVPAGIFDAYRITCKNRRRDGPKAAIEEYYYAPDSGCGNLPLLEPEAARHRLQATASQAPELAPRISPVLRWRCCR